MSIDSNADNIAIALRTTYYAMHREADAALTASGVTADQFVLLWILKNTEAGELITQQELGRRASSDPNTVREMLILLENRGLVTRRAHPTDGRALCVALSSAGRKAFDEIRKQTTSFRDRLNSALNPIETKRLLKYLERVTKGITAQVPAERTRGQEPARQRAKSTGTFK